MALSRGMNQEASQDTDLGLLDATLMQNLQDRFCDANNVYLVCLSRTRGVVTKAYGSKEELAYIHGLTGVERHMTLMNRLLDDGIESVLEEDCGNDLKYRYIKMKGKATSDRIAELEELFEQNRDNAKIREMKRDVEEYERTVKRKVQLEEQARLKEREAERLNENASRLKNK